jgi:hypothetical protein
LKRAALATLDIQRIALEHGMSLRDASAFNIQFCPSGPVLIDTLSFEEYRVGTTWPAYGQFCRHFLAPLSLMSYVDVRLGGLFRVHLDGVPLDLASRLLPARTRLRPSLALHIHAHAFSQKWAERDASTARGRRAKFSRRAMLGLIDNLRSAVARLRYVPRSSEWGTYYEETNYSPRAMSHKAQFVEEMVAAGRPRSVWDLGANTGRFSQIAAATAELVVSMDSEHDCVEMLSSQLPQGPAGAGFVLPLWVDLCNPSPGLGWAHQERTALFDRNSPDMILALALLHHLAIGNNLPLARIAEFFASRSRLLVIEFVPKEDSQVQRMLRSREDIFNEYDQDGFESCFGRFFEFVRTVPIVDSVRTLYLLERK